MLYIYICTFSSLVLMINFSRSNLNYDVKLFAQYVSFRRVSEMSRNWLTNYKKKSTTYLMFLKGRGFKNDSVLCFSYVSFSGLVILS